MSDKVYFGGIAGLADVTNAANVSALLATGTVGLYMHENAMSAAYAAGELPAISTAMRGTVGGEVELGLVRDGVGFFAGWYQMVITSNGFAPTAANVNCDFTSPTFTTDWNDFVNAGKAAGLQTVAPVFTPNTGTLPANGWSDPSYSSIKAAALYGGAIAIDAPPAFFIARGGGYQTFVENEIQWAHQNNLRVSVILSPYGDDSTFQVDCADFISMVDKAGALPTDWAVENYTSDPTQVGSDTDPNSIAGVALWAAQNAPVYGITPPAIALGLGSDTLSFSVSEDAYKGSAQFTVSVDGKQIGGVQTATMLHSASQLQAYEVHGNFGSGGHVVAVSFLNDAYAGTSSTDRNLYVSNITYNGVEMPNGFAALMTTSTIRLMVGAPDTLILDVSEDFYKGDAQFTVSIDGTKVGGTYTATALHSTGQGQRLVLHGDWGPGTHNVSVGFNNDLYGGSTSADRNLYVTASSFDGTAQAVNFVEYNNGSTSFKVVSSSVYTSGTAGGVITTEGNDTVQAGSGAVTITGTGPSAAIFGGTGTLTFIAQNGNDTINGGAGNQTITGGSGSLQYTAGHGNASIFAGTGKALFTIENGQAGNVLTITDFQTSKDTIHLAGYSTATEIRNQTVVGGSTHILLSDNTTIDLIGLTSVKASQIFS